LQCVAFCTLNNEVDIVVMWLDAKEHQ
jgi:hypothetical protein